MKTFTTVGSLENNRPSEAWAQGDPLRGIQTDDHILLPARSP